MDCEKVKSLIIERVDNNLPEKVKQEIDEHIRHCLSCQNEYIKIGEMINLLTEIEDEQPDGSLRSNFYTMLNAEVNKTTFAHSFKQYFFINRKNILNILKYAAMIIFFTAVGYSIGLRSVWKAEKDNEIARLRKEISNLQLNNNLVSLNQISASQRLKVINTVNNSNSVDKETLNALIKTLNTDDNANVRMAATYVLAKHSEIDFVRNALINSLKKQTDPIVQISLIIVLLDIKDEKAKSALQDIIKNKEIIPEVKQQAEAGLSVYM